MIDVFDLIHKWFVGLADGFRQPHANILWWGVDPDPTMRSAYDRGVTFGQLIGRTVDR